MSEKSRIEIIELVLRKMMSEKEKTALIQLVLRDTKMNRLEKKKVLKWIRKLECEE